jgi:tetratricopeptide (TPR) repeat protein
LDISLLRQIPHLYELKIDESDLNVIAANQLSKVMLSCWVDYPWSSAFPNLAEAETFSKRGDYLQAIPKFDSAVKQARKLLGVDNLVEHKILIEKATTLFRVGNIGEAISTAHQALLEVRRVAPNSRQEADVLCQLASFMDDVPSPPSAFVKRAIELRTQARVLFCKSGRDYHTMNLASRNEYQLAQDLVRIGSKIQARSIYETLILAMVEVGDSSTSSEDFFKTLNYARFNYGNLCLDQAPQDYREAKESYESVLRDHSHRPELDEQLLWGLVRALTEGQPSTQNLAEAQKKLTTLCQRYPQNTKYRSKLVDVENKLDRTH